MSSHKTPDQSFHRRESLSQEPLVSIIMSVYNCETTVREALNSIIDQTYTNWELIVCDDGSSDATLELVKNSLEDIPEAKYTLLVNKVNRRLAFSLNRCLEVASGDFIARMDGDDISQPERIERQMKFLRENPKIDLVGTAMRRFNSHGPGEVLHPATLEPDSRTLGRSSRTPFAHATILARRDVFDAVGNYTVSPRTARAEDLDLWYKFYAAGLNGRNIPDALYWVREDAAAIRRRTPKSRIDGVLIRIQGNRLLGYSLREYIPAFVEFLKVFVPYRIFDWQRDHSRNRAIKEERAQS